MQGSWFKGEVTQTTLGDNDFSHKVLPSFPASAQKVFADFVKQPGRFSYKLSMLGHKLELSDRASYKKLCASEKRQCSRRVIVQGQQKFI